MSSDPSVFTKKIHRLSIALLASGILNISVLTLLLHWALREHPPTPYCEGKPATLEQQQIPLADQRGCAEVLHQLMGLSFSQLIQSLSHTQLIENGYAERDLALACLVAFHHFDIERALPKNIQPQQKRYLAWKGKNQTTPSTLIVYPDLSEKQYELLNQFAKTEHWPLTSEGLFIALLENKKNDQQDKNLEDTFLLTPEFWSIELLFNHPEHRIDKQDILDLLLEGTWSMIKQFHDQQKRSLDTSIARRQKFLLDYVKKGGRKGATLLLNTEWDFIVKKLDDEQVIAILHTMPESPQSNRFAKEMLASPRGTEVWQKASQWLFRQAGEFSPKEWNYEFVLAKFLPEKPKIELIPKPIPPQAKAKKVELPLPKKGTSSSFAFQKSKQIEKKPTEKYVVQQGDSLWKIASLYAIKVDDLKNINGLRSDSLHPGMILKIPKKKT